MMYALAEAGGAVHGLIDEAVTTALTSGFAEVASGYTAIVKVALPAALTVFALSFALRKGIGFFRSIAG